MRSNNTLRNHHDKMKNARNSKIIIIETLKGIFDVFLIAVCYYLSGHLTGLWYHNVNLWVYPEIGQSSIIFSLKDGSFFEISFLRYAWMCGLWFGGLISLFSAIRHFAKMCDAVWRKFKHHRAIATGAVIEGPTKLFD